MRITQNMLSANMLKNLTNSYENMGKYQDQLATGKRINRPSDDPVVAMKGISYRNNLQEVEQFKRNFSEAYNWNENSDSSLDKATQALQRIRELTVQASNDTYDASQRDGIKQEITQLKEQLVQIANTKFGDKYLFNGTDTTEQPVDLTTTPPTVSTNNNPVKIELSKGVYIQVNADPSKVFTLDNSTTPPSGLFGDIDNLINKLSDPNSTGDDINAELGKLDGHLQNVTDARSELGARMNRIQLMENRVDEQEVIANKVMSDNEDADIEKVITNLKAEESVQRAALSVGARIIQPSLMDFLR
ncbi:flagellar hook-associated protein FlgL [Falsibacillus albus]|uniref:Flagellar hook-associated protein FlgL n=1 Tax=Falsibacillus albus TaxID=2478915 RepID=A0A3L7K452_9BACI|nr:flagellar hook-associated protein FlgL [Falsibacillus albus]RLQ96791.1 flagellar hook-associated protein FlgL [Falsibacillus albus]